LAIGAQITSGARYIYTFVAATSAFTSTAAANLDDDATTNTWTVDESGAVINIIDDRSSCR
jgi:hypothetical protein